MLQLMRSLQEQVAQEGGEKVDENSHQPITCPQAQTGTSLESVAEQVGVSSNTLHRAEAIQRAAATDPEVAADWEAAKEGKTSVNRVYRKIKVKNAKKHYSAGIFISQQC